MITGKSSLTDVCFAVSQALEAHGIAAVLTGGSAAAVYAPHVYTSDDADFVLERDEPLIEIADALSSIGFKRDGKIADLHTSRHQVHDRFSARSARRRR